MKTEITKIMEIDYAHVLPNHFGFCSEIHGHRAKIEATFSGDIQKEGSSQGMVVDFKKCKEIMMKEIHDILDHGFAVWKDDTEEVIVWLVDDKGETTGETCHLSTLDFIKARNKKVLVTDDPPTAECLAKWAYESILNGLRLMNIKDNTFVKLVKVRWYETPSAHCDYTGDM